LNLDGTLATLRRRSAHATLAARRQLLANQFLRDPFSRPRPRFALDVRPRSAARRAVRHS
jgi:hypothetical protein